MKAKCVALLVGMVLLGATTAGAADITYAVSEFAGDNTDGVGIGGSITTDGTIGPIGLANIVDWNLIGTAIRPIPGVTTAFFDLTPANSFIDSNIANITATANALTLGVASGAIIPNGELLFVSDFPTPSEFIEFAAETPSPPSLPFQEFTVFQGGGAATNFAGTSDLTFADGKVIPTVPVPGPIAGSGLPGLFAACGGALAWWRREAKGAGSR